mmetsp:Transcript_22333/g.63971  ORF Transcript_22333/g.63971 Transcript_22333/m.63971 type:complete len:331 (+) Transcript_22333:2235-3227(+)
MLRHHEVEDLEHFAARALLLDVVLELHAVHALEHVLRAAGGHDDHDQQDQAVEDIPQVVYILSSHVPVREGPPNEDGHDPSPKPLHVVRTRQDPRRQQGPRHEQLHTRLPLHGTVDVAVMLHHPAALIPRAIMLKLPARHAQGGQALRGQVHEEADDHWPKDPLPRNAHADHRGYKQGQGETDVRVGRGPARDVDAARLRRAEEDHAQQADAGDASRGAIGDALGLGGLLELRLQLRVPVVHTPPVVDDAPGPLRVQALAREVVDAVAGQVVRLALLVAVVALLVPCSGHPSLPALGRSLCDLDEGVALEDVADDHHSKHHPAEGDRPEL